MTVEPVANQKAGRFTRVARLWSPDFRGGEPPTSDLYDPELVSMDEHCMQLRGHNVVKTADGRHELYGQRWIVRITDLFGGGFFNPGAAIKGGIDRHP